MTRERPLAPFELDPARIQPAQIELVEEPEPKPPVALPEVEPPKPRRPWLRLFVLGAIAWLLALLGLEAHDFITGLFERSVWLGGAFAALFGATVMGALGIAARELRSLWRLERVEEIRTEARPLLASQVHGQAETLLPKVERLYSAREPIADRIERFHRQASDALNDSERLRLFATTVLEPLDRRAYQLVKRGARDIAAVTALSPLGILDSLFVLARTLSMLRAIARLYGVRPGAAATVHLLRHTVRNVLAAGASELLSDAAVEMAGASLVSVLSARAGQGAANGLLAAKLGLSAMQICRPLPFTEDELPSLRQLRAEILGSSPQTR
jgi:putative membrane protein